MELSSENRRVVYIPCGFAHGFISKSDYATVIYMQTTMHYMNHDSGIRWDSFGFDWGIDKPVVSKWDASLVPLNGFKSPF